MYKELLIHVLSQETTRVVFPDLQLSAAELLELTSYQMLQKFKAVMEDDSLDDAACFMKIEEIVRLFEAVGSHCDTRHDFG